MQSYPCIGGNHDGLNYPAYADAETIQWSLGLTSRDTYIREMLILGDAAITVYVHESLTPEEVLNLLVEHYRAWRVNQPGGRR